MDKLSPLWREPSGALDDPFDCRAKAISRPSATPITVDSSDQKSRARELQNVLFPELVRLQAVEADQRKSLSLVEQTDLQLVTASYDASGLASRFRSMTKSDLNEKEVVEVHNISPEEFKREFVMKNQPLIIRNGTQQLCWQTHLWDDDYLKRKVGSNFLQVRAKPKKHADGTRHFDGEKETVDLTVGEFLDSLDQNPAPYYAARVLVKDKVPELLEDLEPVPGLFTAFGAQKPVNPISYLGASAQATQCHFDNAENLVMVVDGIKYFDLHPPGTTGMYPKENAHKKATSLYTRMDYFNPNLQRFPLAKDLRPLHVELHRGDILYVPICWWHAVRGGEERNQIVAFFFDQPEEKVDKDVAAFRILENMARLCDTDKSDNFTTTPMAWKHLMKVAQEHIARAPMAFRHLMKALDAQQHA